MKTARRSGLRAFSSPRPAAMSPNDFREVLRLLDSAVALFNPRRRQNPAQLRRELRRLSLEMDLFRARFGQPAPALRRN
jgi:hypothetical protein